MGKSAPSVGDPFRNLQSLIFPGLVTPTFSLQRQTPAQSVTTTTPGSAQTVQDFGGEIGQVQIGSATSPVTSTSTTPASGPFQLSRLDQTVPDLERKLFSLLGENREGILGRLGSITGARNRLAGAEGRIPGLFGASSALRGDLDTLAGEVTPGFGRLTEARVGAVRNRFSESVGNLRGALSKRGLQGSSFAINETRRAELDFAQEEDQVRAESFVQELDLRRQIVGDMGKLIQLDQASLGREAQLIGLRLGLNEQEAGVFRDELVNIQNQSALLGQQISRELNELGISGSIVNQAQAIIANLAAVQAQLAGQAAADSGSLFGSLLGFAGGLFASDRRLKKDISKIGEFNGLNVYLFRYLWSPIKYIGVMADEVLGINPSAVVVLPSGYMAVDYSRL